MNLYKVWIQIKQVDQSQKHLHSVGPRYEAGEFNSEAEATRFIKNELLIARPVKLDLQKVCQAGLQFLDSLAGVEPTRQSREAFRKMLSDALNRNAPIVDDRCPKCGAGYKERELIGREFIDIEAIHVHYRCNRCGSRLIEEFKLADVFTYEPPAP
jgi:uncharacterized membrane protein